MNVVGSDAIGTNRLLERSGAASKTRKPAPPIYLIYVCAKELACLQPIAERMAQRGLEVVLQYIENLKTSGRAESWARFEAEPYAVFLVAGRASYEAAMALRKQGQNFACYVTHGMAPYKKAAYARHVLDYDLHLSSTPMIRDRLARLYPEQAAKFVMTGYPRLTALQRLMRDRARLNEEIIQLYFKPGLPRVAVFFSWGLTQATIDALPDKDNIVYVFHPDAEQAGIIARPWRHALALVSSMTLVAEILNTAQFIAGDLSSITLEAVAAGREVFLFLDRGIYIENYDLEDSFLDPESAGYLQAPHTDFRLDPQTVINFSKLVEILDTADVTKGFAKCKALRRSSLPAALFPPTHIEPVEQCIAAINNVFPLPFNDPPMKPHDAALEQIIGIAFLLALNRQPDAGGLAHYKHRYQSEPVASAAEKASLLTLIFVQLASSLEGQRSRANPVHRSPLLRYLDTAAQLKPGQH